MSIPGYDPVDIEGSLETHITSEEVEEMLSESYRAAYREGEADLADLLAEGRL